MISRPCSPMSIDDDPAPTLLDSLSDSAMQIDTPKCTKPPAAWFLGTASSAPGTSSLGGGDPSLIISANPILYFKALDYLTPRELKNWALVSRHNYLLYTVYQRYVQSKLECQVMQRLGLPCSPAFTEEDGDYLPSRALFGRLLNLFEPDLDYYLFRDHYHSTWQQWNTTVEVRYLQISVIELEQELPICALIQKQQPGCNRAVLAYVGKLFACTQAIPSIGEANMARVLQHWKPLWPTAYLVSLDNQDAQSQALAMAAKQYVYRRLLPILVYSCIVEGNLPLLSALLRLVYRQAENGLEHLCCNPFLWMAQLAAHGHKEFLTQWWDTLADLSSMPLFVMAGVVDRQGLLDQLINLIKAHSLGAAGGILCSCWGQGHDAERPVQLRQQLHPQLADSWEGMVLNQGHFFVRLSATRSPSLSGTRVGGAVATGSVRGLHPVRDRRGNRSQ